jgi:hypothetical protein
VETKPTKAIVAAVLTVLGLLGVTLTDGGSQLVAAIVQLVVVGYGVWRVPNRPKPKRGGVGTFNRHAGGQL